MDYLEAAEGGESIKPRVHVRGNRRTIKKSSCEQATEKKYSLILSLSSIALKN